MHTVIVLLILCAALMVWMLIGYWIGRFNARLEYQRDKHVMDAPVDIWDPDVGLVWLYCWPVLLLILSVEAMLKRWPWLRRGLNINALVDRMADRYSSKGTK